MVAVYCKNNTKHVNTFRGQSVKFFKVTACSRYSISL